VCELPKRWGSVFVRGASTFLDCGRRQRRNENPVVIEHLVSLCMASSATFMSSFLTYLLLQKLQLHIFIVLQSFVQERLSFSSPPGS
jgi:hypothetical protein